VEEATTVGLPREVIEIRRLAHGSAASLEGCVAAQSSMDTSLVVIVGEAIQLPMQVGTVPEESLVEVLAPKGPDEPLDERMRARHERNRLDFLDVENAQIRSPTMKAE